ncbi:SH3 domain-containing protein [Meridianimarinicoccus sp. RP-17]|uniref:SH3 domain-containing protein n=1 Tax=Meridianimarinicoccus zhengii TaxID=2056810 RepID=UPI000DAC70D9|nr:SH3 domain-containing protein [Phycocomes zhengii]
MAFRLTILLLLAIFGVMYLAPDAPPRPDRMAAADPAPLPPAETPAPAEDAAPGPLPEAAPLEPAPPGPADSAGTQDAPDATAAAAPPADSPADLPDVTVTPPPDDTGPVTLPGLGFGDPGGDTADALSLSDAARARAARAAANARANTPEDPVVNSVSEAADDLLRGLVAGGQTTSAPPVTVTTPPQPTDTNPPPAAQLGRVTGNAVNLRAGPSTANDVVGQVTLGQTLRVLDPDSDGWATVELPATGARAYIASQFLEVLP